MVPLSHYLILSAILFSIGVVGVLVRRNIIIIFMCIELMLSAVNLAFLASSRYMNNMEGHIFVFIVMTVAAAEAAVGLAIIVSIFRSLHTIDADDINIMKW